MNKLTRKQKKLITENVFQNYDLSYGEKDYFDSLTRKHFNIDYDVNIDSDEYEDYDEVQNWQCEKIFEYIEVEAKKEAKDIIKNNLYFIVDEDEIITNYDYRYRDLYNIELKRKELEERKKELETILSENNNLKIKLSKI